MDCRDGYSLSLSCRGGILSWHGLERWSTNWTYGVEVGSLWKWAAERGYRLNMCSGDGYCQGVCCKDGIHARHRVQRWSTVWKWAVAVCTSLPECLSRQYLSLLLTISEYIISPVHNTISPVLPGSTQNDSNTMHICIIQANINSMFHYFAHCLLLSWPIATQPNSTDFKWLNIESNHLPHSSFNYTLQLRSIERVFLYCKQSTHDESSKQHTYGK